MFELRKIGIVRRASAWLLDAILLSVLAVGLMFIISLICNYSHEERLADEYFASWESFREEYVPDVARYYGFTYTVTDEESGAFEIKKGDKAAGLEDVVAALADSEGKDAETAEAYDAYMVLPSVAVVNRQYEYVYTLLFMMVSLGLVLGYMILEFIVPLCLKNGQTVGKKIFSIGLVRIDCVKIKPIALFARTLLGKFAIETMFPVLLAFLFFFGGIGLLAIILFAALLLLNTVLFFATANHTPIHDLIAGTVAVDIKLQVIFDSEEELVQKKAEVRKDFINSTKEG